MKRPPVVPIEIEAAQDEGERFVEALIRGEIADAIFAAICDELGISPHAVPAGGSALEYIVTASARGARH